MYSMQAISDSKREKYEHSGEANPAFDNYRRSVCFPVAAKIVVVATLGVTTSRNRNIVCAGANVFCRALDVPSLGGIA